MDTYYQCQICGTIHKVKYNSLVDDELFIYMLCPHCRTETKQLWVGDKEEDRFFYYNANLDAKYYEYNREQND